MEKSSFLTFEYPSRLYIRSFLELSLKLICCGIFLGLAGCSVADWPLKSLKTEGCKFRTYANAELPGYISARFRSDPSLRTLIVPFDVPESFASPGNEMQHFGRTLAQVFKGELVRRGTLSIVELFSQDSWPGKRDEFFDGNYRSIELARNFGYHLVIVGFMENPTNDEEMNIHTKIIDTTNNVTVWWAKTMVFARDRSLSRVLSDTKMLRDRPDLFNFAERSEQFAFCTVKRIHDAPRVPEE